MNHMKLCQGNWVRLPHGSNVTVRGLSVTCSSKGLPEDQLAHFPSVSRRNTGKQELGGSDGQASDAVPRTFSMRR